MTPLDIIEVLTAATPIVASVTNMASKNKSENNDRKENPAMNISITINNNFYTSSEREAMMAASKLQDQLLSGIAAANNRYIV